MNRSSDYHSNHRMHLEMNRASYTPRPTGLNDHGSITNLQGTKTTAQSEKTAQERRHLELHTTQARTCGIEPTQIPDSLREHNRRQENNKQHELMCMYMYIYIYTHTYAYIYIYILNILSLRQASPGLVARGARAEHRNIIIIITIVITIVHVCI